MNHLRTASGQEVFPIGMGSYNIASWENPATAERLRTTGYKNVEPIYGNEDNEIASLRYGLEHGQNYLDTAGIYGGGYTNVIIGRALAGIQKSREDLFISHNVWKSDFDDVHEMVETHLGKLGIDYFDVAGPHSPHTQGWDVPPWQATMEDFASLKAEGLIRGVSVSNFSVDQIEEAERILGFPVTTAQAGFSVLDQGETKRELRDYSDDKGIQYVGYWTLNGGVLQNDTVREVAAAHEVSPARAALAFVLGEKVLPIVKSTNPNHIDDNIAAVSLELTESEIEALRNVG